MKEMEVKVQSTEDPAVLDRILTLLMQGSASMDAPSLDPGKNPVPFTVQDKFAPTPKNETQLRLWKTVRCPGRKAKETTLRYKFSSFLCIIMIVMGKFAKYTSILRQPKGEQLQLWNKLQL